MRRLLICLLALGIAMPAIGQTPKYKIPPVVPILHASRMFLQQNSANLGIHPQRVQVIYYAQDFPSAPSGNMKNVYFRYGRHGVPTPVPTIYYDLMVKIGHTQRMTWKGGSQLDTFESALSTVHVSPVYTHDFNQDTQGTWFRLPVNAGNFYYDGTNNFVVEISFGPKKPVNHIAIVAQTRPGQRMLTGRADTPVSTGGSPYIVEFGFDQATTGVEALGNIRSFGLFPNPVTDGRFNLSFEASGPVREAVVTVTNAAGQQVLRQRYTDIGSRFFREVDIRGAASGLYFVEVTVDGERIVRRVVVE